LWHAAQDAKANALAKGEPLFMSLSETQLEIHADFVCLTIEYQDKYGIAVFQPDIIQRESPE
jgi:hypothetical protein